jgi:hypothetical protein
VVLHLLQVVHFDGYGLSSAQSDFLLAETLAFTMLSASGVSVSRVMTSPAVSPHSCPFATTERSLSTTKVRLAGSSAGGTSRHWWAGAGA